MTNKLNLGKHIGCLTFQLAGRDLTSGSSSLYIKNAAPVNT